VVILRVAILAMKPQKGLIGSGSIGLTIFPSFLYKKQAEHLEIERKDELDKWGLPDKFFRPILQIQKDLKGDIIKSDESGHPIVEKKLFLLDVQIPEEVIRDSHPRLARYLEEGHLQSVSSRYLCSPRGTYSKTLRLRRLYALI